MYNTNKAKLVAESLLILRLIFTILVD